MDGRAVYLVAIALSVVTNYTVAEPQGLDNQVEKRGFQCPKGKCADDASIAVWRLVNDGAEHDCNINLKADFEKSVNISDVTNLAAVAEYMRRLEKRDVQCCYLQGFAMNRGPDGWPNTCNYDGKCRRKCREHPFRITDPPPCKENECEDHGRYAALAKKVHDRNWGCDYNWNMTGQQYGHVEREKFLAYMDSVPAWAVRCCYLKSVQITYDSDPGHPSDSPYVTYIDKCEKTCNKPGEC